MPKITVDWRRTRDKTDLNPGLTRFTRYLERLGLKRTQLNYILTN
jgi:hypothetical protein